MNRETPGHESAIGPRDRAGLISFSPSAASNWLGSVGMEAARYPDAPATEIELPPLTHHTLVLFNRLPDELDLRYEDVNRHVPPPAGSISVIPAGSPVRWRWSGPKDSLHVFLEPRLVAQVAAESFELDPARVVVPPLDRLDLPQLRAAMQAVDAELTAGSAGGNLAAESLANVLAVYLIRHVSAPRGPARDPDGKLPQSRLRVVVDYIEDHLDTGATLEELAAVAHLSPYHFARQFRAATGLPPHQFVIARRVERARQFLREDGDLPLVQVASRAGFSDQSQFARHFKRLVGVTPGRFRQRASFAKRGEFEQTTEKSHRITLGSLVGDWAVSSVEGNTQSGPE
jgi:AraC family transcriptional regulator